MRFSVGEEPTNMLGDATIFQVLRSGQDCSMSLIIRVLTPVAVEGVQKEQNFGSKPCAQENLPDIVTKTFQPW